MNIFYVVNNKVKNQVVKVSPGGSLSGGKGAARPCSLGAKGMLF